MAFGCSPFCLPCLVSSSKASFEPSTQLRGSLPQGLRACLQRPPIRPSFSSDDTFTECTSLGCFLCKLGGCEIFPLEFSGCSDLEPPPWGQSTSIWDGSPSYDLAASPICS